MRALIIGSRIGGLCHGASPLLLLARGPFFPCVSTQADDADDGASVAGLAVIPDDDGQERT